MRQNRGSFKGILISPNFLSKFPKLVTILDKPNKFTLFQLGYIKKEEAFLSNLFNRRSFFYHF